MAESKEALAESLAEACQYVESFGASLPTSVGVLALGVREKAPFIAMCLRESLLWRVEELGRNALAALERGDEATGIVLARCVTEATAMIWRLHSLLENRAARRAAALHDDLKNMWLGSRHDPAMPKAINIMTMIDHLDREIPRFRHTYDMLSEVAHPNWTGVAGLYCRTDYEEHIAYFGRGVRGDHNSRSASSLLVGGLGLFQHAYNKIGDLLPDWLAELTPLASDDQAGA
jgi:hypothetical protein